MYRHIENKQYHTFRNFICKEGLLLLLMVVFFSGILGTIGFYITFLILPLLIIRNGFWRYFDSTSIWLIIFSISYSIISTIHGFNNDTKGNIFFYSVFPPMFYLLGRYLMDKWYSQKYNLFLLLIVPIAVTIILGVIQDIMQNGFANGSRLVKVAGIESSATLCGVSVSLCVVCLGMIFTITKSKKEKFLQLLLLFWGVLGIICVIHLINRTGLVVTLLSSSIVFLVNIHYYSLRKILIISVFATLPIFMLYPTLKNYNVIEIYKEREEDPESSSSTGGGRIKRWQEGFENIYKKPMGGGVFGTSNYRHYAHNFWLDVAEITGILPLFALLMSTIINLRINYRIIRSHNTNSFLSSWLIALNIGFLLTCFVEPIMEGAFVYANIYFCFWGMTSIIYLKNKLVR